MCAIETKWPKNEEELPALCSEESEPEGERPMHGEDMSDDDDDSSGDEGAVQVVEQLWEIVRSRQTKRAERRKKLVKMHYGCGCEAGKECREKNDIKDDMNKTKTQKRNERKKRASTGPRVSVLTTIIPQESLRELELLGEWEVLELAVDSGATETVIAEDSLRAVRTEEGDASRQGVVYEVANGVQIPNLGEKKFVGTSEEGISRGLKAQIADVNKGLLSVAKVVKSGNRVVFEEGGSFIEDKETGERMWLEEKNGMYMLKMWVRNPGFPRQGQ